MLGTIRHLGKLATDPIYRERSRLLNLPRKQRGTTKLLGPDLHFVDGRSAALQHLVIFDQGIYMANIDNPNPRIVDAGANIGMATIYFKRMQPSANVIAFEADPKIAEVLYRNVQSFELANVEVRNEAVSNSSTRPLFFVPDGVDGGRVAEQDGPGRTLVKSVRLRDILEERIDFLKLDVEGAEVDIIFDCADRLQNVSNLFLEYHSFVGKDQIFPELLKIIRDSGMRIFIQTDYCPSSPLAKREDHAGMDLRLNVFGVRV